MADEEVRAAIEGAQPVDLDQQRRDAQQGHNATRGQCPVIPVGADERHAYFLTPAGMLLALRPHNLDGRGIKWLFAGNEGWLINSFPIVQEFEDGPRVTGWSRGQAESYLIREACNAGRFDVTRQVRQSGIWRDSEGGLIIHAGAEIYRTAARKWQRAGYREGGFVYPTDNPQPRPDLDNPATVADGQRLLEILGLWNYEQLRDPTLMLGFIGSGNLCGALDFRGHIYVSGGLGTGKTALQTLTVAALGVVESMSRPTAAGVAGSLGDRNMPIVIDEIEAGPDGHAAAVMEIARLASTGSQPAIVKGTREGGSRRQLIRASFYFTSILHPNLKPQDRSRITPIRLLPLDNPVSPAALREHIAEMRKLSARFRARAILAYGAYLQTWDMARAILLENSKSRREADQLATLIAGASIMLHSEPLSQSQLANWLGDIELYEDDVTEPEWQECLGHLLSASVDSRPGTETTVGMLLQRSLEQDEYQRARDRLAYYGIRLFPDSHQWEIMRVANQHHSLENIYQRGAGGLPTRWVGGVWAQALAQAPGAYRVSRQIRFAGRPSRYVELPAMHVFASDEESG